MILEWLKKPIEWLTYGLAFLIYLSIVYGCAKTPEPIPCKCDYPKLIIPEPTKASKTVSPSFEYLKIKFLAT